jgi:hypothetical protein
MCQTSSLLKKGLVILATKEKEEKESFQRKNDQKLHTPETKIRKLDFRTL